MPRFTRTSSRRVTRRLVATLALATTMAVPALVVIAGQTPASASGPGISSTTTVVTVNPDWIKMH